MVPCGWGDSTQGDTNLEGDLLPQGKHADFIGEGGVAAHWMPEILLVSVGRAGSIVTGQANKQHKVGGWMGMQKRVWASVLKKGWDHMILVLGEPGEVINRQSQSCKVAKGLHVLHTWLGQNTTRGPQTHTSD